MPPQRVALALSLLAACFIGCAVPVKEDVYNQPPVTVFLRSQKSWQLGSLIERDYNHPITIAPVRLANILSRIDARLAGKRQPAIDTDMLFPIADGMSRAFARAGSEQEVVVMALRKSRHLVLFDHDYLTSLIAYVKGDQLILELARINWEVPKRQEDKPPEPQLGEHRMEFRVYPSDAMELIDKQTVAINWRDEVFARETRMKVLPSGKVVRKNILLESDVEPPPAAGEGTPAESEEVRVAPLPLGLSPEQLRALADLEEARRAGTITEAEYTAKQQEILASGSPAPAPPPSR